MKCPHCNIEIHPAFMRETVANGQYIGRQGVKRAFFSLSQMTCPACADAIIYLNKKSDGYDQNETLVYPKSAIRPKAPVEVPPELSVDFNEACLVLGDSPKASAALSRRCLQQLLKLQGHDQRDLAKAIDSAIASKQIPGPLSRNLDAIRNIGNFAAHPTKDTNSGAIVEVEPEEADWNLDVLDGLFDYYYVQPAHDQARIDALNIKLLAAGKPAMKQ